MEFGIVILGIIIILNLIIVYYVFKIGVQHDAHHEIKTVEASESVMTLRQRAEEYNRKIAARDAALSKSSVTSEASTEAAGAEEGQVSNQLGDEEERQKRREAALKRKAERQASRTTQTEGE